MLLQIQRVFYQTKQTNFVVLRARLKASAGRLLCMPALIKAHIRDHSTMM